MARLVLNSFYDKDMFKIQLPGQHSPEEIASFIVETICRERAIDSDLFKLLSGTSQNKDESKMA